MRNNEGKNETKIHFLDEAPEREIQDVTNRVQCQGHCLGEKSFQCKKRVNFVGCSLRQEGN